MSLIFIESEYSYLLKLFQTTMLIVLAIRYLISGLLDTTYKKGTHFLLPASDDTKKHFGFANLKHSICKSIFIEFAC